MKKRQMLMPGMFLLALCAGGAIINIAVAWIYLICLWDVGGKRTSVQSRVSAPEVLIVTRDESAVATLVILERFAAQSVVDLPDEQFAPNAWLNAPAWIDARKRSAEFDLAMNSFGDEPVSEAGMFLATGWPSRSMHCQLIRGVNNGNLALASERQEGGLRFGDQSSPRSDVNVLPCIPLWPGFAINTIFYAAVLWVLRMVPGAVRRRVRRKRGLCASCGYSLRESVSEKCPECGCSTPSPSGRGTG